MSPLKLAAAAVVAATLYSPASAATCSATVAGALTPNSGCFQSLSGNDSASALSGVFGVTDWVLLAKDNDLNGTDEGDASLLTVTGDTKSGTITVAQSVFDMFGSVSLVLKGPNSGNSTPSSFIAYLVTSASPLVSIFNYTSPYVNQRGRQQDLSHISLYAGDPTPPPAVPLPATLLLLAGALGGLGALRRRKTHTA